MTATAAEATITMVSTPKQGGQELILLPHYSEAFLDIETTGLSADHHEITVVGINLTNALDSRFVQMVGADVTAGNIMETLSGISTIYTYNGSRFDLPFIHCRLGINLASRFGHRDLMYDCWRHNLYGGLKGVEHQLGIPRRLHEINGLEAIRLWWRYVNDADQTALNTLLAYNKEDALNLLALKAKLLDDGR